MKACAAQLVALLGLFAQNALSYGSNVYEHIPDLSGCPLNIQQSGREWMNWTFFPHLHPVVNNCEYRPKLLMLPTYNPAADKKAVTGVRAAISTKGDDFDVMSLLDETNYFEGYVMFNVSLDIGYKYGDGQEGERGMIGQAYRAIQQMQAYLAIKENANLTTLFAQYGQTAIGVYVGKEVNHRGFVYETLRRYYEYFWEHGMPQSSYFQSCGTNTTGDFSFGIYADTTGGVEAAEKAQEAVAAWSSGLCLNGTDMVGSDTLKSVAFLTFPEDSLISYNKTSPTSINSTTEFKLKRNPGSFSRLSQRADCRTIRVVSGEGCPELANRCGVSSNDFEKNFNKETSNLCSTLIEGQLVCCTSGSLYRGTPNSDGTCKLETVQDPDSCGKIAERCGISAVDLQKYNSKTTNFCPSILPGQKVCCSPGSFPDIKPKPNADGSCSTYTVQRGDGCQKIAISHGLTVEELVKLNQKTWGWLNCKDGTYLYEGDVVCVSLGSPPMPNPISNAICGPRKPHSTKPSDGISLALLNPCPLNACCNIWGQCGTTDEFCVDTTVDGIPGTAKEGTDGCISNCGMRIVNNANPPALFRKVVYFEAWNWERNCLWWDVSDIDQSKYNIIHFAFARITPQFTVDVSLVQQQFDKFKALGGSAKKVIAFGGWVDSTKADKFWILRNMVLPENRATAAQNIANFIKNNEFDGVDIDWEYPAAQDIRGIPPDDPTNAQNFYVFLQALRQLLGSGKTLSIAAPASFWYLKPYPMNDIGKLVDYVIYMTYDLHGQWDVGNKWSQAGCDGGNCLRSHINITSTINALSMITKSGIQANKVIVGVASYGRSFRMAKVGCTGPMCTFTGTALESYAKKGVCTDTSGYISNAEINLLKEQKGDSVQMWQDSASNSDIMVYDSTEWVAYMSESTKNDRTTYYKRQNFGGTTDWAVDLGSFTKSELSYTSPTIFKEIESGGKCIWRTLDGMDCLRKGATDSTTMTRKERWWDLGAPCAWRELRANWTNEKGSKFSVWASEKLDGGENMRCEVITGVVNENSCEGPTLLCANTRDAGPASFLILNSFMALNGRFTAWYNGFRDASDRMGGKMSEFVETFAPEETEPNTLYLILDAIGLGISMILPPIFNSVLSRKDLPNSRDESYAIVPWIVTIAKDLVVSESEDLSNHAKIESSLYLVTDLWMKYIDKTILDLFNGSSQSMQILDKIVADGAMIQGRDTVWSPLSATNVRDLSMRILYSNLIPNSWRLNKNVYPVVIDSGEKCSTTGPLDDKMVAGTGDVSWACEPGTDKLFYFVQMNSKYTSVSPCPGDCPWPCTSGSTPGCGITKRPFAALAGIENLAKGDEGPASDDIAEASKRWGGITRQDLVMGALATLKMWPNNAAVGYDAAWVTNDGERSLGNFWTSQEKPNINVRAPGNVRIPVCGWELAQYNWEHYSNYEEGGSGKMKPKEYPCGPKES